MRRCGLHRVQGLQYAGVVNRLLRPFLLALLVMALFAQGTAAACMLMSQSLSSESQHTVEQQANPTCHTAPSDEPDSSTCSACAACCLGALLLSGLTPQHPVQPGSVHCSDAPRLWQTYVAEHPDPPPRHR
jgi:hypothetical protein